MADKTHEPESFVSNPRQVSALEYVNTVIRAYDDAGLVLERTHLYQIGQKLMDELQLPRLRLLQAVNRMTDACAIGKDTVEVSVDDLRIFMQIGKHLV